MSQSQDCTNYIQSPFCRSCWAQPINLEYSVNLITVKFGDNQNFIQSNIQDDRKNLVVAIVSNMPKEENICLFDSVYDQVISISYFLFSYKREKQKSCFQRIFHLLPIRSTFFLNFICSNTRRVRQITKLEGATRRRKRQRQICIVIEIARHIATKIVGRRRTLAPIRRFGRLCNKELSSSSSQINNIGQSGLKVDSTFDDFVDYHALGWTVF